MNWLTKLLNDANFHTIAALATGAASLAFPAYAGPLQVAAGVFAGPALVLPGGSVLGTPPGPVPVATPVINLPTAEGGGSYHKVDYEKLGLALLAQFAKPEQGRS